MSMTHGKHHDDFRAVCAVHTCCTLTKSRRFHRPMGRLQAWLDFADTPECRNAEDPRAAHRDFVPSFAQRVGARDVFESIVDAADLLQGECGRPGDGEPVDTW